MYKVQQFAYQAITSLEGGEKVQQIVALVPPLCAPNPATMFLPNRITYTKSRATSEKLQNLHARARLAHIGRRSPTNFMPDWARTVLAHELLRKHQLPTE
jgi:hypothetical protein